jgi:hypothetical protein
MTVAFNPDTFYPHLIVGMRRRESSERLIFFAPGTGVRRKAWTCGRKRRSPLDQSPDRLLQFVKVRTVL